MAVNITTRFAGENHLRAVLTDTELELLRFARTATSTVGQQIKQDIVQRTLTGRDIRGQFFTTYRRTQAEKKSRRQPVTLADVGSMMGSLRTGRIKGENTVTIYFGSIAMEERGRHHHFGWTQKGHLIPAREWFGVSQASLDRARVSFGEKLRAELVNTPLHSGRLKILISHQ